MRNVIFVLPIMLLLAVSSANAQRGPMWMDEDLNLTDQQQQKLEDLRFQHQKVMIQMALLNRFTGILMMEHMEQV